MDEDPSAAEEALSKLQAWTQASLEPGDFVTPIAAMKVDRNGLCYGEAPRDAGPESLAAHAGAYREVANGADVLAGLVYQHELEKERSNPSAEPPPPVYHEAHQRHPVVFVNAENRDLVIRQADNGDVSVLALQTYANSELAAAAAAAAASSPAAEGAGVNNGRGEKHRGRKGNR